MRDWFRSMADKALQKMESQPRRGARGWDSTFWSALSAIERNQSRMGLPAPLLLPRSASRARRGECQRPATLSLHLNPVNERRLELLDQAERRERIGFAH